MTSKAVDRETIDAVASEVTFRALQRQMFQPATAAARPAIATGRLLAYARRAPQVPADLAIEQALRRDPATALRYRRLLSGTAIAHSPTAMAAATGRYPERTLGAFRLRVVDEGDVIYLILSASSDATLPRLLEAHGKVGFTRLELPAAVRGHVTVPIDRDSKTGVELLALLEDVSSELFLL